MNNSDTFLKNTNKQEFNNNSNYVENKLVDNNLTKIPTWFEVYKDNWSVGSLINLRIFHIYDPSKFWIITRHRELESFQMYLFTTYNKQYESLQIPIEEIKINLYCAAFIEDGYYRCVIVNCPPSYSQPRTVRVFCIDFGSVVTVSVNFLFYLKENCKLLPQFAVRASLAKIRPYNSERWTKSHVDYFKEITQNKILEGLIVNIDYDKKILNLQLAELKPADNNLVQIHKVLIDKKIAEYATIKEKIKPNDKEGIIVKYLYLFPSFDLLENGRVPSDVATSEFLMNIYPPHILYSNYYNKNVKF